jgi:hypothetical protein
MAEYYRKKIYDLVSAQQLLIPDVHVVQMPFRSFVTFEHLLARCDWQIVHVEIGREYKE